ncbi:hypothetical protein GCM10023238_28400 [Streptomyces heliomycini]
MPLLEIPHRRIDKLPEDVDRRGCYEERTQRAGRATTTSGSSRFTAFHGTASAGEHVLHGDGGAAFEKNLRSLDFPAGVRTWTDTDLASLAFQAWAGSEQTGWRELTEENTGVWEGADRAKGRGAPGPRPCGAHSSVMYARPARGGRSPAPGTGRGGGTRVPGGS